MPKKFGKSYKIDIIKVMHYAYKNLQEDLYAFKQGDQSITQYFTTLRKLCHQILKGLNEQYSHICAQIMMMNLFPLINKVFSILIQQERQQIVLVEEGKIISNANKPYMHGHPHSINNGKAIKIYT